MSKRLFIVWASTRTGSTILCKALGGEDEPFLAGPHMYCQAWRYEKWLKTRDPRLLDTYFEQPRGLKHIPDTFENGFNIALAQTATRHGYRHIRLTRLNEVARLISEDVAGQLNIWKPDNPRAAYADVLAGKRTLNLLDVPRLISASRHALAQWRTIESHTGPCLHVHMEHLTSPSISVRHAALTRLLRFLEISPCSLARIDSAVAAGNQDTGRIYGLIQNADELRTALQKEGIL